MKSPRNAVPVSIQFYNRKVLLVWEKIYARKKMHRQIILLQDLEVQEVKGSRRIVFHNIEHVSKPSYDNLFKIILDPIKIDDCRFC